jgi:hypothetical protein
MSRFIDWSREKEDTALIAGGQISWGWNDHYPTFRYFNSIEDVLQSDNLEYLAKTHQLTYCKRAFNIYAEYLGSLVCGIDYGTIIAKERG